MASTKEIAEKIPGIIRSVLPHVTVTIEDVGPSTIAGQRRYKVKTSKFFIRRSIEVRFNVGENVTFFIDSIPIVTEKYTALAAPRSLEAFAVQCLNRLDRYIELLEKQSIPLVQAFARKHLGQERSVKKDKDSITIQYDKFYICVTPVSIYIVLALNDRIIWTKNLVDETPNFDKIFSIFKGYAKDINAGKIM